jgi:hypothetical protein
MPGQVVVTEPDRSIRFLLTVPVTRFGVGPFSIDPLVDGPRRQRTADGSSEIVTCLARLSPGMRASLPLGTLGEVGVAV